MSKSLIQNLMYFTTLISFDETEIRKRFLNYFSLAGCQDADVHCGNSLGTTQNYRVRKCMILLRTLVEYASINLQTNPGSDVLIRQRSKIKNLRLLS